MGDPAQAAVVYRRRRWIAVGVVVGLVVVAGSAVGWSRWQVGGAAAAWTMRIEGALRIADYDDERLLVATEDGFALVSRADGSVQGRAVIPRIWDRRPLSFDPGGLALTADGILVAGANGTGVGVVSHDGEWSWLQEHDDPETVVGVNDTRVILRATASDELRALDTASGDEAWTSAVDGAVVENSTLFGGEHMARETFTETTLIAVKELRGADPGTVPLRVLSAADGTDVAEVERAEGTGDAELVVIGPYDVLANPIGDCDVRLVHDGAAVAVDWQTDPPESCEVVPPSGGTVYLAAGGGDAPRVFTVDPVSGAAREVAIDDGLRGDPRLAGADGWFPVEAADGVRVYDATTGEQTWAHSWRGEERPARNRVAAVGAEVFVTRDDPTAWDRLLGGAGATVFEARTPGGDRLGALFTRGEQGTADVRVLDNREAVVVLSDGSVTMLG
jgi:outer membrane protein assembly factor BamB